MVFTKNFFFYNYPVSPHLICYFCFLFLNITQIACHTRKINANYKSGLFLLLCFAFSFHLPDTKLQVEGWGHQC